MTHEDFKAAYLPLSDGAYRIAIHYLEDSDEARDIVQELYTRLWSSKEKLDGIGNPKAYAYTLVKNLCIDRLRKSGRTTALGELPERSSDDPPDRELATKETLRKVMQCMNELPQRQQTILRMRIFEGLEYDKIAQRMGMTEINTRVQLSLARKSLRSKMHDEL